MQSCVIVLNLCNYNYRRYSTSAVDLAKNLIVLTRYKETKALPRPAMQCYLKRLIQV